MISAKSADDHGYAALACMLAAACMALLAVQVMRVSRSSADLAGAGLTRARLAEAASAGLSAAEAILGSIDLSAPTDPDGQRTMIIEGVRVSIRMEAESGKVPINTATEAQMRALFLGAGVDGAALDKLTQAFFDFRDPTRQGASERRTGPPPLGGFRSIVELAQVPGLSPQLFATLSPTVTATKGAFNPGQASTLAISAMSGPGAAGVRAIEQRWEMEGERTALSSDPPQPRAGRMYTVRVDAIDHADNQLKTATLIELTGNPDHPALVHERLE